MLLLVVVGMVVGVVVAGPALEGMAQSTPVVLPIGLVGVILVFAVVMPFLLAAYDKTTCRSLAEISAESATKTWWKSAVSVEKRAENSVKDVVKMVVFLSGKIRHVHCS